AFENGKIKKRKVAFLNYLFARTSGDGFRKELAEVGQHRKHSDFVEQPLGRFHVHELLDTLRNPVERIHPKSQLHAALRAELVDEQLRSRMSFEVLEEA